MAEPARTNPPAPSPARSKPGPVRWTIAIVLVALAAWAGWHTYRVFGQRRVVQHVDELGGMVVYDFEDPENRDAKASGPNFIASILGNDYAHDVVDVNLSVTERDALTDEDLEKVSGLSSVHTLSVNRGKEVTNEGLAVLAKMPGLRKLSLSNFPQVTDEGLAVLASLPELRKLRLSNLPKITDEGLRRHLAALSMLEELTINNCPINGSGWQGLQAKSLAILDASSCEVNDAGLEHLAGAAGLKELSLAQNKITGPGLKHLKGLSNLAQLRLGENPLDPATAVPALSTITSLRLLTVAGTKVGRKEGEELSKALPECDITVAGATYDPEEKKWLDEGQDQE